jgi:hypothetical protein
MKIIKFPEHNIVYAENQPEYMPLPAFKVGDRKGTIICCWKLSWRERFKLFMTGLIWHRIMTFNHPLQPQLLEVDKPLKTETPEMKNYEHHAPKKQN